MLPGVGCDERILHPTMGDLGTLDHAPEGARAAVAQGCCRETSSSSSPWEEEEVVRRCLCPVSAGPPTTGYPGGVNLPLSVPHRESRAPCSQLGPCSPLRVPKSESGPPSWVPPGKLRHAGGMQRQRGGHGEVGSRAQPKVTQVVLGTAEPGMLSGPGLPPH